MKPSAQAGTMISYPCFERYKFAACLIASRISQFQRQQDCGNCNIAGTLCKALEKKDYKMGAGPKEQHWLPSAYLKFFVINGDVKGRNSRVLVVTRDSEIDKKASKTAVARYTYSQANPALDHEFNDMENDYPLIIEKLRAGTSLTRREELGLLLTVFDFHHRNIAYENRSSTERFDAYQRISRDWFKQVLPPEIYQLGMQEYCDYLNQKWQVVTVSPATSEKFITSDHPSLILTAEYGRKPIAALLPVAPDLMVVCFDSGALRLDHEKVSDDALGVLNGLQVARCVEEIYSDHPIKGKDNWDKVVELFDRPNPERWVDDSYYKPDHYSIANNFFPRLNFLQTVS